MELNNCYVYTLKHVDENKIFYVGRGTLHHDQFDRYTEHLRKAKMGSDLYVHRKIRKIQSQGSGLIHFDVVSNGLTFSESQALEVKLIASYGLDNLTNITAGGDDHPLKDANPEQRQAFIQRIKDGMGTRQVFLEKENPPESWNFESGIEAAKLLGVSPQAICQAARRNRTTKGYKVTMGQTLIPKNKRTTNNFS